MECKLYDIITLGNKPASGNLILGEIVMFHISQDILNENNQVDPMLLDAISRMGGSWYSKSNSGLFEFKKPRHNGIGFDKIPSKILKSHNITANELAQLASIQSEPQILIDIYKDLQIDWNPETAGSLDDINKSIKIDDVRDSMIDCLQSTNNVNYRKLSNTTIESAKVLYDQHK